MASWHQISVSPLAPAPTALAFDPFHDLLWTGAPSGHVASYSLNDAALPTLSRYTAYRGHIPGPVSDITLQERAILSVGDSGVKLATRRGLALWNVCGQDIPSTPCACFANSQESQIVVGGLAPHGSSEGPPLTLLNTTTGTTLRQVQNNLSVSHIKRSHNVYAGTSDGSIVLMDPKSLNIEHKIDAHIGGLAGLEADGPMILSIGYSIKNGVAITDPLVKVYDARMLRPLPPISFPAGPAFIRIHPRNHSTILVCSSRGQMQISSSSNLSDFQYHQIPITSYMTSMAVSPTGQGLAFADYDGFLHLWGASDEPQFSRFSRELDFPDPVEPPPAINWSPSTPLNMIGMPYYTSPLLSNVPFEHYTSQYTPMYHAPAKPDPELVANMKVIDWVGYALNPRKTRRNQAIKGGAKARDAKRRMNVPLFRSEKARAKKSSGNNNEQEEQDDESETDQTLATMPKYYRKVEIKYSRFGVDDFDFAFYNKTKFSGLETHIANSYANAVLQALRFITPICKIAESHTYDPCPKENCLLCELGFLFRMLKDAQGVNCRASNFSRVFNAHPKAQTLGLMDRSDEASSQSAYSAMIQTFNRFLFDQIDAESKLVQNAPINQTPDTQKYGSIISKLINFQAETVTYCPSCGHRSVRSSTSRAIDLIYPRKALSNEVQPATDFTSILQTSVLREQSIRAQCSGCNSMQHLRIKRHLAKDADLPAVLTINAAVSSASQLSCWLDGSQRYQDQNKPQQGRFLPSRLWIGKDDTNLLLQTDSDNSFADKSNLVEYELKTLIVQIQADDDPAHLVSIVNAQDDPSGEPAWHLFNDFLVQPISQDEALSFIGSWKIPAIVYYQRVDSKQTLESLPLSSFVDASILSRDVSLSKNRDPSLIKHQLLRQDDLPRKGTMIAIDAEFVSLQEEEVEYRSNGVKTIIRPAQMSLARVSVLRGEGPDTGIPFVDDHIETSQLISDYVTEFSGIKPGDLDPRTSKHTLVPLKVAYKKLRALVDLGCVFIGHGLANDFRIINIFVPQEQIVDTVHIYHIPERHRRISLRFLCWVVFNQDIQAGSHDSIVDARTALQLYERYIKAEAEGTWDDMLEDIYAEGRRLNWKVPVVT